MRIPVVPKDRVHRLAESIHLTLGDDEVRKMSHDLSKIAVDNYDWKIRASEMVSAYESILRSSQ
jgi:hypothetical protein